MKQKQLKIPKIATGVIKVHPRGFGFVIPDERALFPQDIFIPRQAIKGAVDGDRVEVAVNTGYISEKGPEGRVKKILERGRSHVAGVISYVGKKGQIYAYIPLLGEDQAMRIVPHLEKSLSKGDRIIIHVLDWGGRQREPLGEMSAYIGHISDPSFDIMAAIEEFELHDKFSQGAIEEARGFGEQVSSRDLKKREDLRELECFTIDPDTAKDFDDALSITKDKKGRYHLGVHIADVSHYVKPGTLLDQEASSRCNSVYFPGTVLPMLPHELSSHLCSLKQGVSRLTISILMVLESDGSMQDYRIHRSVIKSQKRFTYREAKEVLDGKKRSRHTESLHLMVELCLLLKKRRAARGSIEFSLPDLSIQVNEKGLVQKIELIEYDITHQLVEEFMLLANEVVATHLGKSGKPLAYRIHEKPSPENIRDFALTSFMMGFPLPASPTAEELQRLFEMADKTPFGQFLATAFIRSMKLASYSTENIGHYGLGLDFYTHFTSPIRRYIDLLVHRVLFDELEEENDLEVLALRCSEQERVSAKAENSVLLLKKLRLLQERSSLGESDYEAIIVAIKNFGLIFEIKEFMYEGFLPIVEKGFALGDRVLVKLREVDLIARRTEWDLISVKKKHPKRK